MLRKFPFLLLLALGVALGFIQGCSNSGHSIIPASVTDDAGDQVNESIVDSGIVNTRFLQSQALAYVYPNFSFGLNVPWICQVPPMDPNHTLTQAWALTNNCGQAVTVMLGGFFNNGVVASWVIDDENRWLHYPLPYGSGTSSSTLISLLWNYHRVHAVEYHSVDGYVPDVVNEVVANRRPTIACVTIKGGILVPRGTSGSRTHWVLVIGWDGQLVLNDPGSKYGQYRHCTISDFRSTWADNYCYIPTWK